MKASKLWLNEAISQGDELSFRSVEFPESESRTMEIIRAELERFCRFGEEKAPALRLCLKRGAEPEGGFRIERNKDAIILEAGHETSLLCAAYALIRQARQGRLKEEFVLREAPQTSLRMINHWDNMDGSIERGYAGRSFFFRDDQIILNERTEDYCRLLASLGINAVCFNNVNVKDAATYLITERYFTELRALFELFSAYGITPYLSLNYAAPLELGELDTADPLDEGVIAWWENKMAEVFRALPELGGFVVKADSEGRPGPFTYGRNQAEGANLLARAAKPYGGKIIWRAFVYNCQQDWRDYKTDRARASSDYFMGLDGEFDENVYLQVKNGPMDFQVREPVTPLFCGMPKTKLILELQIAQEYTGQQIDLFYLAPMWKEILNFETERDDKPTLAEVCRPGFAAVANTGDDLNWCGHAMAAANLYAFGRLAWDPQLCAEEILDEWLDMSLELKPETRQVIKQMMLSSPMIYENYTAPLGIGWMVTPHTHYGPSVDGYEYSRWGTYHRADHWGIGVDRTEAGTGYASLYPPRRASLYEHLETCPDELLLFFHHVPYQHVLKSGKTVIQHIYDTHFAGLEQVRAYAEAWAALEGEVEEDFYQNVSERLSRQLDNAAEWCDQVNSYFYRKSGIPDEKGRTIY